MLGCIFGWLFKLFSHIMSRACNELCFKRTWISIGRNTNRLLVHSIYILKFMHQWRRCYGSGNDDMVTGVELFSRKPYVYWWTSVEASKVYQWRLSAICLKANCCNFLPSTIYFLYGIMNNGSHALMTKKYMLLVHSNQWICTVLFPILSIQYSILSTQ